MKGIARWYDYKNQVALTLPPRGEEVFTRDDFDNFMPDGVSLGINKFGKCVIEFHWGRIESNDLMDFRPIDYKVVAERNELERAKSEISELICYGFYADDPEGIAEAILAAGYRKCNNN